MYKSLKRLVRSQQHGVLDKQRLPDWTNEILTVLLSETGHRYCVLIVPVY